MGYSRLERSRDCRALRLPEGSGSPSTVSSRLRVFCSGAMTCCERSTNPGWRRSVPEWSKKRAPHLPCGSSGCRSQVASHCLTDPPETTAQARPQQQAPSNKVSAQRTSAGRAYPSRGGEVCKVRVRRRRRVIRPVRVVRLATGGSYVIEQRHESKIHMQLLMAVE